VIASHDLRSPLGSIQVMADMLLEGDYELPEEPHRRFLGHIRSAAQQLLGRPGRAAPPASELASGACNCVANHP
jgi:hypothetical protein